MKPCHIDMLQTSTSGYIAIYNITQDKGQKKKNIHLHAAPNNITQDRGQKGNTHLHTAAIRNITQDKGQKENTHLLPRQGTEGDSFQVLSCDYANLFLEGSSKVGKFAPAPF